MAPAKTEEKVGPQTLEQAFSQSPILIATSLSNQDFKVVYPSGCHQLVVANGGAANLELAYTQLFPSVMRAELYGTQLTIDLPVTARSGGRIANAATDVANDSPELLAAAVKKIIERTNMADRHILILLTIR